jgi:hypothetical protein
VPNHYRALKELIELYEDKGDSEKAEKIRNELNPQ